MNAYLDSSVVLRVVLGEPGVLLEWHDIESPVSSELIRVEALRTVDRARIRIGLDDDEVSRLREDLMEAVDSFALLAVDRSVMARAAMPFPTLIGTLDAIHLASALLLRERISDLVLATHDRGLATAARATGFEVLGDW